jgi:hypothetical protein
MAQRSRADKVEVGRKAAARKIAQHGPDELSRAGRQAAWTKQHPGRDKSENPYLREKIYQSTDLDRAKNFKAGAKTIPTSRWNAERQAVEFGVIIGEYQGVVRVSRRVFQRLLPEGPTPERCVEAYYL